MIKERSRSDQNSLESLLHSDHSAIISKTALFSIFINTVNKHKCFYWFPPGLNQIQTICTSSGDGKGGGWMMVVGIKAADRAVMKINHSLSWAISYLEHKYKQWHKLWKITKKLVLIIKISHFGSYNPSSENPDGFGKKRVEICSTVLP